MLHECRATHVLWVIWDAEVDGNVTLIAKFDPRKVQFQVTLGQISKFKIFVQKMPN